MNPKYRYNWAKIFLLLMVFVAIITTICMMTYTYLKPFGKDVSAMLSITIFLSISMFVGIALMAIGIADPKILKAAPRKEDYPDEFIEIYDELTLKDFVNIDELRKKANRLNKFRMLNIFIIVISTVILFFGEMEFYSIAFIFVAMIAVFSTLVLIETTQGISKAIGEYKRIFKREIIPEFIKKINSNFEFDIYDNFKRGVYDDLYSESKFNTYSIYNNIQSDDYIEGKIDDGAIIRLIDMTNKYTDDEGTYIEFEGLFGVLYTKIIDPNIDIRIRLSMGIRDYDMSSVKTGYEKIDSMYCIYTENKELIVELIKSGFFDEFNRLLVTTSTYPEIIVKDGKYYVRCYASGMFEPKLSDDSKMLDPLYYYYENFKAVLDVFEMGRKHFGNLK